MTGSHFSPDGHVGVEVSQYFEFLHPSTNAAVNTTDHNRVAFIRRFPSS
jgi:hypothetical protein